MAKPGMRLDVHLDIDAPRLVADEGVRDRALVRDGDRVVGLVSITDVGRLVARR